MMKRPGIVFCLWVGLAASVCAQEKAAPAQSRWEPQIQQLEKKAPAEPGGILFIGSSSIRLWDVDQSFPGWNIVNQGFGGSQVADSVEFFDRLVVPHQPGTIVLYAGDNDINAKKSPIRVYEDFQKFVAKAHAALPEAKVVYIAIKPSVKRWGLIHKIRAANALIRMECEEDPLLEFVDVETPMLGPDGTPPADLFVADGLHMTPKGYAIWKEALIPHLPADKAPAAK